MLQAQRHPHLACQRCHANLVCFLLPVAVQGNGSACIQTVCALGQDYRPSAFPGLFESLADLGLSEKQVFDSLGSLAVVSTSDIERVMGWIGLLASYLVETFGAALVEGAEASRARDIAAPPLVQRRASICISCENTSGAT